jgi:hypothetical protein
MLKVRLEVYLLNMHRRIYSIKEPDIGLTVRQSMT